MSVVFALTIALLCAQRFGLAIASPAITMPTPPPGSLRIPLMTDAELRARLKTDPVFAAQIREHDAEYMSGKNASNVKQVLQALHLTVPSQLNLDYVYVYSKDTGHAQAISRSQLGTMHVVPMSLLNAIGDNYWLNSVNKNVKWVTLNAQVWANCTVEWFGFIPIGGCGTGEIGVWYGPRYGQVAGYSGANIGWTFASETLQAAVLNAGFGYYHFVAENAWADTHITLVQEVEGGAQLFGN